jgi:ABC-type cobalamin transport system ATPase subunit
MPILSYEQAWQTLFKKLSVEERLVIISFPKGQRALRHAKEALLLSQGKSPLERNPELTEE